MVASHYSWPSCWKINHCVKSVQILCFFWSVFSRIQTGHGEILDLRKYQECLSCINYSGKIQRCFTAQKREFSIKDFFSKRDQIVNGKLHFYAVFILSGSINSLHALAPLIPCIFFINVELINCLNANCRNF